MVVDDTLSLRIYSFIDNILIIKTIKEIKQKIDFNVFCARHLGLIVTAVTINGFTPVILVKNRYRCNRIQSRKMIRDLSSVLQIRDGCIKKTDSTVKK